MNCSGSSFTAAIMFLLFFWPDCRHRSQDRKYG